MEIKGPWHVTNNPQNINNAENMAIFAGRWNSGIQIHISNPFEISEGPIIKAIDSFKNDQDSTF
jgi:hypothetical protein